MSTSTAEDDIHFRYDYLDSFTKYATDKDRDEYMDCLKVSDHITCTEMFHFRFEAQQPTVKPVSTCSTFKSWWLGNNYRSPAGCSHWSMNRTHSDDVRNELLAFAALIPLVYLIKHRKAGVNTISDLLASRPVKMTRKHGMLGAAAVSVLASLAVGRKRGR